MECRRRRRIGITSTAEPPDDLGTAQQHQACLKSKSSSAPTSGIEASTSLKLRLASRVSAARRISRCSALRQCRAAASFKACATEGSMLRTTRLVAIRCSGRLRCLHCSGERKHCNHSHIPPSTSPLRVIRRDQKMLYT